MNELLLHVDSHRDEQIDLLMRWSAINSGTHNLVGLSKMLDALRDAFGSLGAREERIDLPPAESIDASGNTVRAPLGRAIRFIKRPDAPKRVLLNIHYDTVYPSDSAFQWPKLIDANTLNGPGVTDAKGGIVVMLAALRAIESVGDFRDRLGWEVLLNPDEEIGSPGSVAILRESAKRHTTALLFEPALSDGSLVGPRKGSGGFTVIVRGRAAHSGRDFLSGRSAILALAEFITKLDIASRDLGGGVTVNCGRIDGGGAINVVPDLAIGRFNVRVNNSTEMQRAEETIHSIATEIGQRDGITLSVHGGFASPPKPVDAKSQGLFAMALECAKEIGLGELQIKPSGGASDGNKIATAGVALIDTLGPVGGEIHSDREFVKLDSIAQRAKLTACILSKLATG